MRFLAHIIPRRLLDQLDRQRALASGHILVSSSEKCKSEADVITVGKDVEIHSLSNPIRTAIIINSVHKGSFCSKYATNRTIMSRGYLNVY